MLDRDDILAISYSVRRSEYQTYKSLSPRNIRDVYAGKPDLRTEYRLYLTNFVSFPRFAGLSVI